VISYAPLFKTLKEKNVQLIDLIRECKLSPATVAKFRKNESVTLETISRVCCYLNVPIERVVIIHCNRT
jgi:putative transcriptional regulator